METVGIRLEVDARDVSGAGKELAKFELELDKVRKQLAEARKAADPEAYAKYREEQIRLQRTTADLRKSIRDQEKAFKDAKFPEDSIIGLRKRYRELKREIDGISSSDPKFAEKAREAKALSDQINGLSKEAGSYKDNIGRYAEDIGGLFGNVGALAGGIAAGGGLIAGLEALREGVGFITETTTEFITLRGQVGQSTGATGQDLDNLSVKVKAISKTFQQEGLEITKAVTQIQDQLGTSFEQSGQLLQDGLLAAVDQADFVGRVNDELKQLTDLGLPPDSVIALLVEASNKGLNVDVLAEPIIRLREATPATVDALEAAFGPQGTQRLFATFQDAPLEAIRQISQRLNELGPRSQAAGLILADVFSSAGEDAVATARSISDLQTSLDALIDPTNELVQRNQRLLEVNSQIAEAQKELANQSRDVTESFTLLGKRALVVVLQGIIAFFNIIKAIPEFIRENKAELIALGVALVSFNAQLIASTAATLATSAAQRAVAIATTAWTTAQKLLNVALRANPIGIIVTAVSLLVGGFIAAYRRSEEFRASISGLGEVAKEVFSIIKESLSAFIGTFKSLADGDFRGAVQSFGGVLQKGNPIEIAITQGDRLKKAFVKGYSDKLAEEAEKATGDEMKKAGAGIEKQGEGTGESFGKGFDKGFKKTLATTSLAFLEKKVQDLNQRLSEAPDQTTFLRISDQIRQAQSDLDLATAAYQRFVDAQRGITALVRAIPSAAPGISQGATNEQLVGGIISQLGLEAEAEKELAAETAEIVNEIKLQAQEDFLQRRKEKFEEQLEQERELAEAQQGIITDAYGQIGEALGSFLSGQTDSLKDFLKQVIIATLSAVEKTILLTTVEAQAKVIAANAGIPGIGLAKGLAESALVAGLIKGLFAGIKSFVQSFDAGGLILPQLEAGMIRHRPNIPARRGGDNVLVTARAGEMVLNREQQMRAHALFGQDIWKRLGVPGFQGGGLVTPQLINPSTFISSQARLQPVSLDPESLNVQAAAIAGQVAEATGEAIEAGIERASQRAERRRKLEQSIQS